MTAPHDDRHKTAQQPAGPPLASSFPVREIDRRRAEAEDRQRMLQNAAAIVFIVVFVCFSAWLIDRLAAYNRNLSCLQSHHRNCG